MRLPVLERPVLYLNQAFLHNPNPVADQREQITYTGEGDVVRMESFAKILQRLKQAYAADPGKSDGPVAVELHRALRLTRREAAHMGFWHFLSIMQFSDYVAWRFFDASTGKTNKQRFIGSLAENAFARLWWWAELTRVAKGSDPYVLTMKGAQNLELVKSVVENLFGGNHTLVASLIDLVCASPERMSDQMVKQLTTRLNALLVTVAVDLLPPEVVQQIPRGIAGTQRKGF